MTGKPGRPQGNSAAREELISAARNLFVSMPYNKVSTRLIAAQAGVNASLIRYYFGDKAGLFENMLRTTIAPIADQLKEVIQLGDIDSIDELMRTYYRILSVNPDVPRLITRVMMEPEQDQRAAVESIMLDMISLAQQALFSSVNTKRKLRKGIDPDKARITFISMALFPFLIPPKFFEIQNIKLSKDFLSELAEHNLTVLTEGMLDND